MDLPLEPPGAERPGTRAEFLAMWSQMPIPRVASMRRPCCKSPVRTSSD
jgi:hypothetical protein